MDKKIKKEWIRRLKSGYYKQVGGGLCKIDTEGKTVGYCCLGVLTAMAVEAGVVQWDPKAEEYGWRGVRKNENERGDGPNLFECSLTPIQVAEWSGLRRRNPNVGESEDGVPQTLASLNDAGRSFKEIAKIIKEKL